ncbi:MAG: winged helix-turn-helix transcriptional regulator [Tissierellaceae bacterium]|nr:winged helix-turn-helix transcriptional regulator [Tissierellaceae bacterium]
MKDKIFNGFEIVQDLIKLRWVPEILKSIDQGHERYSDILNSIPYMSHTELNRKLAILTDKRVINRVVEDSNISYTLLNFGEDLVHIFNHLENLEERYFQSS